jgi:hypothetical protein
MNVALSFRRGLALLAAAGSLAVPAGPAFAWGRLAHRASAKLAESRLTPAARAAVREILEPGESLADASTWADEHSGDIPGSRAWHYVNVPISADSYDPRDCRGNCIVSRLEEFRAALADRNAPLPRRRMALRYVVHLVQDLHQPLHVGDHRDRGGNALQLTYYRDDRTNLHQLWDSGLFRNRFRHENQLLDEIETRANRPDAKSWRAGTIEDWANESLQAAKIAYKVPGGDEPIRRGTRLGRDYERANLPLATRRVAQSGVRLADMLNAILK